MNTNNIKSKLITHKTILQSNGYRIGPHYIGLTNNAWLFCNAHGKYAHHELLVKSTNEWLYVCEECKCAVQYVG